MGELSRSDSELSIDVRFASFPTTGADDGTELTSADYSASSGPVVAADPLLGMVIAGRYRIRRQLGAGGMGVVYEVEHIDIGKLLAMKLLTGELARSPDLVRRFKREALAASKLHSPNSVQVFDFGVADGLTYLVMELVPGQTLSRVLKREGPLSEGRLAKIVIQICNSLSEAHRHGIVHRDIKPDNVMLLRTPDGAEIVKVLDFGLAKLRDNDGLDDVSGRGMILGTPYYMAPEQIRGEATDGRTDIYSLGALMYVALTGFHPFQGKATDVLLQHLTTYPAPPHERAAGLNAASRMSRLILRALRKDPSERPATVEQLQRELVEDVRARGSSSVDALLDSDWVRHVATIAEPTRKDLLRTPRFATRDDVDAYERRLRKRRVTGTVLASSAALAALGGFGLWCLSRGPIETGFEVEPNDTPNEATPLSFGHAVSASLGKRIDETYGDRDFYSFEVPSGRPQYLSLSVSSLPNMAMCTFVFRRGFAAPMGQYCAGRPGSDLVIPALQLDAGAYFLEATQDTDAYGGPPPLVVENVSDAYHVVVDTVVPGADMETEPDDDPRSAVMVEVGRSVKGRISWNRDEDVYCVSHPSGSNVAGSFRWRVVAGPEERGVLEVTGVEGRNAFTPVRVHGSPGGDTSSADAMSPWLSLVTEMAGADPACIRLRLTRDPWSQASGPTGAGSAYEVSAVSGPP